MDEWMGGWVDGWYFMKTVALTMNFILPVPEASVPAVEICSDRSVAGITKNKEIDSSGNRDATAGVEILTHSFQQRRPCNSPSKPLSVFPSLLDQHSQLH